MVYKTTNISNAMGLESVTQTNLFRVMGDSMINADIFHGDYLFASSAVKPENGEIAVIGWNGFYLVKRIFFGDKHIQLVSENPIYKPMFINEINTVNYIGKVLSKIKDMPSKA